MKELTVLTLNMLTIGRTKFGVVWEAEQGPPEGGARRGGAQEA